MVRALRASEGSPAASGTAGRDHAATPMATTTAAAAIDVRRARIEVDSVDARELAARDAVGIAGRVDVQVEASRVGDDGTGLIDRHRDAALRERPASGREGHFARRQAEADEHAAVAAGGSRVNV